MSELEDIRRKKIEEMQQRYSDQAMQESQIKQQMLQIEAVVRQRLTKEAGQRYSNIRAADPEKANQILLLLAQMLQRGSINMITDDMFKEILARITPQKREMKIRRV